MDHTRLTEAIASARQDLRECHDSSLRRYYLCHFLGLSVQDEVGRALLSRVNNHVRSLIVARWGCSQKFANELSENWGILAALPSFPYEKAAESRSACWSIPVDLTDMVDDEVRNARLTLLDLIEGWLKEEDTK